jgi:hypothetical protein
MFYRLNGKGLDLGEVKDDKCHVGDIVGAVLYKEEKHDG